MRFVVSNSLCGLGQIWWLIKKEEPKDCDGSGGTSDEKTSELDTTV